MTLKASGEVGAQCLARRVGDRHRGSRGRGCAGRRSWSASPRISLVAKGDRAARDARRRHCCQGTVRMEARAP